jgi:hypothetical protein
VTVKVPLNQLPNGSPLSGNEAVPVVQNGVTVQVPASFFLQLGPYSLQNYANDTAAAAGGIQIGYLYRNGSVLQVRVT